MTEPIKREVLRMGVGIFVLGVIEAAVLWLVRRNAGAVLPGAAAGCVTAWIYFILLGLAVERPDRKIQYSLLYLLRFGVIALALYWALTSPAVDSWAAIIPLVFPRLLIPCFAKLDHKKRGQKAQ